MGSAILCRHRFEFEPPEFRDCLNLLMTCRKIYSEAHPLVLGKIHFFFTKPQEFLAYVSLTPPTHLQHICHVTIDFSPGNTSLPCYPFLCGPSCITGCTHFASQQPDLCANVLDSMLAFRMLHVEYNGDRDCDCRIGLLVNTNWSWLDWRDHILFKRAKHCCGDIPPEDGTAFQSCLLLGDHCVARKPWGDSGERRGRATS
ncbi:hypothetical protein P154DRAFT_55857 [Amniculicola lignicola CBS 123094]|uniref:DUF7730 domain-containing protein n=1 Tax=Amniculicola lignicola CBS 123094 TaxID=1392246 RepID=A0A6A5WRG6_9PLEO|nr:hypothetical protein P154DRAFT_55857 [Amniculicola lignicola CBS 123094]